MAQTALQQVVTPSGIIAPVRSTGAQCAPTGRTTPCCLEMRSVDTAIQTLPFAVKPRVVWHRLCWGERFSRAASYRPRAAPAHSARAGRIPVVRIGGGSSIDIDRTMMPCVVPARDMSCADRAGFGRLMPRLRRPQRSTDCPRALRRGREGGRERAMARLILIARTSRMVRWKAGINAVTMRTKKSDVPMVITAARGDRGT